MNSLYVTIYPCMGNMELNSESNSLNNNGLQLIPRTVCALFCPSTSYLNSWHRSILSKYFLTNSANQMKDSGEEYLLSRYILFDFCPQM